MRGEVVNFDLMEIKNKLKQQPAPVNVQQRQDFVDKKIKRRVKKLAEKIADKHIEDAIAQTSIQDVGDGPVLKKQPSEPQNALKELPKTEKSVKTTRKRRTIKKT